MFELIAAIWMWWLCVTWTTKGWFNMVYKSIFALLSLWGFFEAAQSFGYIIKI